MRAFALLLVLGVSASASAAGIAAHVDRNQTTLEDPVVLTVTIDGTMHGEPRLPELPGFEVASRGQSTSMQIINGRMSSSVSYTYMLSPTRVGTFAIPPIAGTVDGRPYQSAPITVIVTKAGTATASGEGTRDAFLEVTLSNPSPYVGEQLVYTFRFYRRVRIHGANAKLPDFDGFTARDLGEQQEFTTTKNGIQYVVTELRRALVAHEPGRKTLRGATLTAEFVSAGRRGLGGFDDFFGRGTTQTKTLRSDDVTLDVRPLPPAPSGFSGLVGRFALEASLSKNDVAVGESLTLRMTLRGEGHLRGAELPRVPALANVKTYDEQSKLEPDPQNPLGETLIGGAALVPTAPGELVVPPLALVYFDPRAGTYETTATSSIVVQVTPGQAVDAPALLPENVRTSEPKSAVRLLADDLLPPHPVAALTLPADAARTRNAWMFLLVAAPLAYLALELVLRRREAHARDPAQARRKRALVKALSVLQDAQARRAKDETHESLVLTTRALREFLGDKLALEGRALTAEDIRGHLVARGVEDTLVRRTYEVARDLEAVHYARGHVDLDVSRVRELITHLDKAV